MEVSLISSSISPESGESFLKCFRKAKGARLVASSPMRAHGRRAKMLRRRFQTSKCCVLSLWYSY